ncbi:hypothetical protein I4U23_020308 [Adineta vaga]|nr:hypothetical protein I4U23_020308 [Adineta vaga]
MANSSNLDLSTMLNSISLQFNRYFSICIFLFGTIGNILNCFVLSRPSLRSNPCVFYFLISSIANMISIACGLTTRILSGWNMDPTTTSVYACKFRAFIMFVSRSIAFWLVASATVDRYLLSSHQYQLRQLSCLKNAQRVTITIILCSLSLYSQVLYCYQANNQSAPLRCYGKTMMCRLVTDMIYTIITILCPLIIMFIFGLLTISNIRRQYEVASGQRELLDISEKKNSKTLKSVNHLHRRRRRIDRYLRHVLLIQVVFLAVLTVPQTIEKFYTTLTINQIKSSLHSTVDKFIYNFVLLLTYLASGMPFYIYTLSGGNTFRSALFDFLRINK